MRTSIHKLQRKIKYTLRLLGRREDIFIVAIIVLVGFGSFGIGKLSIIKEGDHPISIEYSTDEDTVGIPEEGQKEASLASFGLSGAYVASVNSTKYHLPWCGGAKRIKEENKIWFQSKEEAESRGYTPAGNCKGI